MDLISNHFATPRNISSEWRKKLYPDTQLYNMLMYIWFGGIFISIICALLSLFGMSWAYTIIVIAITVLAYIYQQIISAKALKETEHYLINAPLTYAGFCTWWSHIFQGKDGLAIVVYSTDPVLAKDENYIRQVRDNIKILLDGEKKNMTSEEKNIYNNIRNDDKGRYKIGLQKEVPSTLGSKGQTYIANIHFDNNDLPSDFNPHSDLWGMFLKNNKPMTTLSKRIFQK